MTKAQLVAEILDYWEFKGINEIADICQKMAGDEGVDQSWESESTRYMFSDDSAIVISGPCWDFGYTDCFCMADTGHDENCTKGENK